MTPALVTIEEPTRDQSLLERAQTFAIGAKTDLVVVALVTPEEYEKVEQTLETIGRTEHTNYSENAVLNGVSGDISDLVEDILAGTVDYEVWTVVSNRSDQATEVIEIANQTDCDHIFLPGFRRSPTKKAIFGDRTQRVILEFEGYVTVAMK